jgi:glucokinase
MEYVIGVDIGGTRTRAALLDTQGTIINKVQSPTEVALGPNAVIDRIEEYAAQLRSMVPASDTLLGVGIGIAGVIEHSQGIVFTSPNLPGWHHLPLRDILLERTGLPVRVANDANAAALGEWHFGGGIGYNHLVYITVSTGIGAGVIVDGRLLLGRMGAGAELGHVVIETQGRKSWEEMASGTAMRVAAATAMGANPDTILHTLATLQTVTAADVSQAYKHGDQTAQNLMRDEAELLGIGLVNALHLFSPEIILVGGSVVSANPFLLEQACQVVQERVISDVYRSVPIRLAHLGENVGLLGAGSLLLADHY